MDSWIYFTMRARFLILLLLMIVVSFVVGVSIPAYYDWTGSDQSRPSPLLLPTAAILLLTAIGACAALPWIPLADDRSATEGPFRAQFNIRTMLAVTAFIGVLLMALKNFPRDLVSGGLLGAEFSYTIWLCYRERAFRWPVLALLACMYLPYLWIVTWSGFIDALPQILWIGVACPAFFLTALVQGLFNQNTQELVWLAVLLTAVKLVLGLYVMRVGPKLTLAYLIFILIGSIYGSFFLNVLVRI